MPGPSTWVGDTTFRDGNVTFAGTVKLPNASVGDNQVDPTTPIGQTKLKRRFAKSSKQANGASIATVTERMHLAYGATGVIQAVRAQVTGVVGSGGGMSVTIDIKKNGTSILSGVITINASTLLNAITGGSISTAAFVTGEYFDIVVTATAGGGTLPQGLFVDLLVDEDPS